MILFNNKNVLSELTDALQKNNRIVASIQSVRVDSYDVGGKATADMNSITVNIIAPISIKMTVDFWTDSLRTSVDYLISAKDLESNSEVDELANIPKMDDEYKKEFLRLAFIIYDGYRYATTNVRYKDFHPRVVQVTKGTGVYID